MGAALIDNFISGHSPIKETLEKISFYEFVENNNDYSDNDLKERIKSFIKDNDNTEKLYDTFTEMKSNYKKYMFNLQKIKLVKDDIKEQLENLQSKLQNFEFKTEKDIEEMKKNYDEIVNIAIRIIDKLMKELSNKSNVNNQLIAELMEIKVKVSFSSKDKDKDKEAIFKSLENFYLNNW